jgi:hypothetical protein
MVEGIAELATARRARLYATLHRLNDEELRVRVEESFRGTERTIEEWHDFVEGVELAMRASRASRRSDAGHPTHALAGLVAS